MESGILFLNDFFDARVEHVRGVRGIGFVEIAEEIKWREKCSARTLLNFLVLEFPRDSPDAWI